VLALILWVSCVRAAVDVSEAALRWLSGPQLGAVRGLKDAPQALGAVPDRAAAAVVAAITACGDANSFAT
jgi:hypothetical protein